MDASVFKKKVVFVGREYQRLAARDSKLPRIIPPQMTDEEAKYIWRNRKGKLIYTPVYEIYTSTFWDAVIQGTAVNTVFEKFGDTAIYERYMLNGAQFAAAKQAAENELLKKAASLYKDDGSMRGYHEYLPIARDICTRSKDTWLRVEYDNARGNAVSADQFGYFVRDKDIYPYWVYHGVMDARERPDHVALEGKIFIIGDPEGDAVWPRNDWNCRCWGVQVDGRHLEQTGQQPVSGAQARQLLEDHVDEQFRFNAYNQGMMPRNGSYFEAMGNANEGDFRNFGLNPGRDQRGGELEGFAATDLHKVVNIVKKWEKDHHTRRTGEIVFQNTRLFTNVIWNNQSLHEVQKHQRGIENIPATIQDPDEVWTNWADVESQQATKRTYLKFGKTCYLVQTLDGIIQDAFAVTPSAADRFRTGVII